MAYWDLVMCVVAGDDLAVTEPEWEAEVGTWTWPSESWVAACAPLAVDEAEVDEDEEEETSGFEIPNCVEYWNLPVASSMICKP